MRPPNSTRLPCRSPSGHHPGSEREYSRKVSDRKLRAVWYKINNNMLWPLSFMRGSYVVRLRPHRIVHYPYTRHLRLDISSSPFLQFTPTATSNSITLFWRWSASRARSERTQEPSKNGCVKLNHPHMHQGSPLLAICYASSRSLHLHPSPAQCHIHIVQ